MRFLRFAPRRLAAAVLGLLVAQGAQAQITIPPRGNAATFDVAAWNVEFFGEATEGPGSTGPASDTLQFDRVKAVIEQGQIDLWGLEEVVDANDFARLLARIQNDGYAGVLGPNVSSDPVFNQKLAFVYNTSVVQVLSTQTILSSQSFNFAGRLPFEMTARVTVDGTTREVRVIVIHAKATSDVPSFTRRRDASLALKTYVDGQVAMGRTVIVIGDFNDELSRSITSGQPSPYANFVNDPAYVFATAQLDAQNVGTFCGNSTTCNTGSTIDHILLSAPAAAGYVAGSGDRYSELLTAITSPSYVSSTSDHLPVLARLSLPGIAVADEDGPSLAGVALFPAAPSPFRTATTLRFSLAAASDVSIDVVDVLGRTVARLGGAYGAGDHRLAVDGTALAAGIYRVRLRASGVERMQTIVRAR